MSQESTLSEIAKNQLESQQLEQRLGTASPKAANTRAEGLASAEAKSRQFKPVGEKEGKLAQRPPEKRFDILPKAYDTRTLLRNRVLSKKLPEEKKRLQGGYEEPSYLSKEERRKEERREELYQKALLRQATLNPLQVEEELKGGVSL
jgi:hypothetical protein